MIRSRQQALAMLAALACALFLVFGGASLVVPQVTALPTPQASNNSVLTLYFAWIFASLFSSGWHSGKQKQSLTLMEPRKIVGSGVDIVPRSAVLGFCAIKAKGKDTNFPDPDSHILKQLAKSFRLDHVPAA